MTTTRVDRFVSNDMISLTSEQVDFDLAESVGPDLRLSELLSESDYHALANTKLDYGTAQGSEQLREHIAINHGVSAQNVVITVGGMHALFLLGQILVSDNSRVLVVQPAFPLSLCAMQHGQIGVDEVFCGFENNFQIDVSVVAQKLTSTTRLVVIATPQNPSGVAIPTTVIEELLARMRLICPEAYLLVDETYREASYENHPAAQSAITLSERVVVCGSLSKCHGAPGLRTGWAITRDAWLQEQLVRGKFQSVIANSTLDELLALRTLQRADQLLSSRQIQLTAGLALVEEWVLKNQDHVTWIKPDSGALCCVSLNPERYSDEEVSQFYRDLAKQSVRVAPGHWFGESERVFRIGFGLLPTDVTQSALERISDVFSTQTA